MSHTAYVQVNIALQRVTPEVKELLLAALKDAVALVTGLPAEEAGEVRIWGGRRANVVVAVKNDVFPCGIGVNIDRSGNVRLAYDPFFVVPGRAAAEDVRRLYKEEVASLVAKRFRQAYAAHAVARALARRGFRVSAGVKGEYLVVVGSRG